MAASKKMANRYGMDLVFKAYGSETPTCTIDFANEVSIELTGEITWATGGQERSKMIGFKDPKEGSIKITTQVVNSDILALLTDVAPGADSTTYSFKNDSTSKLNYYTITGTTVWQAEDGTIINEEIIAYKALVKPNYSVSYTGEGDPQSIEIELELAAETSGENIGKLIDIKRVEAEVAGA